MACAPGDRKTVYRSGIVQFPSTAKCRAAERGWPAGRGPYQPVLGFTSQRVRGTVDQAAVGFLRLASSYK